MTLVIIITTLTVEAQTIQKSIGQIEIKDSLLFINGDFVPQNNVVEYFYLRFGKPNRKSQGLRNKWKRYIYDDLGISIMVHPKSVSVSFNYFRLIKSEPKNSFKGAVIINGHQINLLYSFDTIQSLLYPCRFLNLFNRSLNGTFFSFEKGLGQSSLSEINWHFVDPKERINQPYKLY